MISADDLVRIDGLLANPAAGGNPLTDFRGAFPGLSLTRCDAFDMRDEQAFREYPAFNLYLVDGRDHCWHITQDINAATGIVVAART
ncbi:hypothetical protein [Thiobacillus sp.]|uniref:hypothetical protein n=1 Tax=Thiobacillus sp. TaxID=924 RepID=UPI0025DF365D|nr:hypothetical protein [Thiobacillus sp.]MBT9540049.1 hypothetical protein [Thiobacillus sp.]